MAVALGGFRLTFLQSLERAAGGHQWMLGTPTSHPIVMLRNSILPRSAEVLIADHDERDEPEVAAQAEAQEAGVVETRRELVKRKKAELEAKKQPGAFQLRSEAKPAWLTIMEHLKVWARLNKFLLPSLIKPLIARDSTTPTLPNRGDGEAVFIRQNPNPEEVAAAAEAAAAEAAAEAAAGADGEAAPAEDIPDEEINVWGSTSEGEEEDEDDEDEEEHTILKVLSGPDEDGWYMVLWLTGDETLVPEENLTNCQDLLDDYNESKKSDYEKSVEINRAANQQRIDAIVASQADAAAPEGQGAAAPSSPPQPPPSPPHPEAPIPVGLREFQPSVPVRDSMDLSPLIDRLSAGSDLITKGTLDQLAASLPATPPQSPVAGAAAEPNKRAQVSPAEGSPDPEPQPSRRTRQSPRFERLPGAVMPTDLQVGDQVRAIYRFSEGGSEKYVGEIMHVEGTGLDARATILYRDNETETDVPRTVITKLPPKNRILDNSPEI